ncbi:hypothetical protein POM88_018429 [Heracleum sosnowskyi]|uniref:Uncharacterized protein n=1 Tax=Heracleum sosnowskyi TaxID=360622 RepID=A0AAD8ISW2_9APIA|nr:hypothetical protein POM88_018429 [Heracleum sosnowskyi]
MACFGCSRRASKKYLPQDHIEQDLVKTGSLTKKKKKINSFMSWPRLWTKKSDSKTVPVDISISGSFDPIGKSHSVKLDKKDIVSSKKYRLPIGVNAINIYKKRLGTVKEIILESREVNHLNSLTEEDKYDKKNSSRKKETKKTKPLSKSNSPPENINPRSVTTRVDQTSLPPQKKAKLATRENGNNDFARHENEDNKEASDSNSMIGLSVIVVILVLMLFLGKLYAIVCTSAWFYMIPRLRTAVDSKVIVDNIGPDSIVPDLNSDEHKKRVVLEGLLQRNQRNVIRIL